MIRNSLGEGYNYLPIVHPVGMPQSIMMDYTNFLGKGPTCLYITGYCPIYYVYVAPSFAAWMERHNYMLENDYYQISALEGEITTWYNVEAIYDEYIKAMLKEDEKLEQSVINELYMKQHEEFNTTSCTVADGFIIQM